ncbi:hypothetical protein [Texcoconibacillus texcoconensis]|uniref:Uncharacterized protein n=1 Tax=Texcoconibacillus texcoconensis TaxID=1095777 RepID=A0A840QQ20_9BACI|nr:hypothetical protein [Texcoconibacillus texcoconensis]MBB5173474.1 hypothetical protein [Texcoconibacillus texcoconensis]
MLIADTQAPYAFLMSSYRRYRLEITSSRQLKQKALLLVGSPVLIADTQAPYAFLVMFLIFWFGYSMEMMLKKKRVRRIMMERKAKKLSVKPYKWTVALTALLILASGCGEEEQSEGAQSEENQEESEYEEPEVEEREGIDRSEDVSLFVEKLPHVYHPQSASSIMMNIDEELEKELQSGDYRVDIPRPNEWFDQVDVSVEKAIQDEESGEIFVDALLSYPEISKADIEHLEDEVITNIKSSANEGKVSFEDVFFETLDAEEFEQKETKKELVLEEIDDDEDSFRFKSIEQPGSFFSSVADLYEQTVAEQIDEVTVEADEENMVDQDTTVQVNYQGEMVETADLQAPYLAENVEITLADGSEVPAGTLWDGVKNEQGATIVALGFSPEDFFHRLKFSDESEQGQRAVYLQRPYAVATEDTVVGYMNTETNDFTVANIVNGSIEGISDLYWSPTEDYVAYSWIASGVGSAHFDVYDIGSEEVISLTELRDLGVEHMYEFSNPSWSEDGETLYVDVVEKEGPEDVIEVEDMQTWQLDVAKRELTEVEKREAGLANS